LGEFATTAHPHGNSAVLLASRKDELVRLHDAHKHIMGEFRRLKKLRPKTRHSELNPSSVIGRDGGGREVLPESDVAAFNAPESDAVAADAADAARSCRRRQRRKNTRARLSYPNPMSQLPPKEEEAEEAQRERWRGLHEISGARDVYLTVMMMMMMTDQKKMQAKIKKIMVEMEKTYSR